MKKETKKRRIMIGISIAVVVLFGLIAVWWFSPEYAPEEIGRIVLDHEADYAFAAELYLRDFEMLDVKEDEFGIWTGYSNGTNGEISCFEDDHVIELTEEETAHMQAIYDSYNSYHYLDNQTWTRIYVYEGFVTFSNEKGHKSIVYSQSGDKPLYVDSPAGAGKNNDNPISVAKIADHWYYVRIRGLL